MNIGECIKRRRIEIGLSVDELAMKLGKNRTTVYRYESNEIENLPITLLEPLANALNTTPVRLIGWEIEKTIALKSLEESDAEMLESYHNLSELGQKEAIKRIKEMASVSEYRKAK
jgi:transcriptional regulator with XRE-family HTH domain